MLGFPNPWVLLGSLVAVVGLVTGTWFYRGHLDAQVAKGQIATIQSKDEAATVQFQREARAREAAQEVLSGRIQSELQAKLNDQAHAAADLADTNQRLLDAVKIYANTGSVGQGLPQADQLAVSNAKLGVLAGLYGELASAGEAAAAKANGVVAKLGTCEATLAAERATP
jgi:hypothetical protein